MSPAVVPPQSYRANIPDMKNWDCEYHFPLLFCLVEGSKVCWLCSVPPFPQKQCQSQERINGYGGHPHAEDNVGHSNDEKERRLSITLSTWRGTHRIHK